jgi:hypothetical protein
MFNVAPTLNWLVNEKGIAPHIPVIDKSKCEEGTFSREDFTFDKARDLYICSAGKVLTTTGTVSTDHSAEARDVARTLAKTAAFEQSCRDRKRVEMLFAYLKRILRLGRLRLRPARSTRRIYSGGYRPEHCAALRSS